MIWLMISLILITWALVGCVGYLCRGLLISNNRLHKMLLAKIDPENISGLKEEIEPNLKDLKLVKKQNTYDLVMSSGEASQKEIETLGIARLE